MGKFTVTSDLDNWSEETLYKLDSLMRLRIGADVHRIAVMNAPHLTGALEDSGRIIREQALQVAVIFGNSRVPYAELRHEFNNAHPGTLKYLERAGDYVAYNLDKYFEGI